MTCPRRVDSLACISLLRFWLSHVALADTEWLRVESVGRGGEGKGPDKDARVLGSNPDPLFRCKKMLIFTSLGS